MDKQHTIKFLGLHLHNICPALQAETVRQHDKGLRIDIDLEGDVSYQQMKMLSLAFDTDIIDIRGSHFAGTEETPGSTDRWLELNHINIDEVFKYIPENHRCSMWAYHEMKDQRDEATPQ